jgi:xanthine dehydrogenase accessory factor
MSDLGLKILIRGGGELASAVACRLSESGFHVLMTETPQPQAVRRRVSFCEAVYEGIMTVEGKTARLVKNASGVYQAWEKDELAIIIDPENTIKDIIRPDVEVDAIIAKKNLGTHKTDAPLVIGLGVGFSAPQDVDVIVETNRGHDLGRLIYHGRAEPDTGNPGVIAGYSTERVLRAPQTGVLRTVREIGDLVLPGDVVAYVGDIPMQSTIPGILRGLLRDGTEVTRGMKSGDVDPRGDPGYIDTISDKGRAIAGGVLEAILTRYNKEQMLYLRNCSETHLVNTRTNLVPV